jgi:type VI secretion system protein ImpA
MDDADSAGGGVTGEATAVDAWLQPLEGAACGEDLEYDNDFLELSQAAAGKAETQFAPAEPPDWRGVKGMAEALFERTRDLRVAILWLRAQVQLEGWRALPEGLRLVHGLLENFWDELHPRPDPDDGDAFARVNALETMGADEGLLSDLRQTQVLGRGGLAQLSGRDLALALGSLEPREDESAPSRGQIEQMLGEALSEDESLARLAPESIERLESIASLMRERVGFERAPTFEALLSVLNELRSLMPEADSAASTDDLGGDASVGQAHGAMRGGGGLGGRIESRDDALRVIEMVCEYLERTEPSNPAQLLLRRAQRLVNKNFLELVRELAPDALGEVSRIMGVASESGGGSEE